MLHLYELDDGRKRYLTWEEYDHFRHALPAAVGTFSWNGERFRFAVAGAQGVLYGFGHQRGRRTDLFFARKTDRLDPRVCGASIEQQYWSNPFIHRPGR
jgi:hypothetical protein